MENSKLLTYQSPAATSVCATSRNIKSPRILAKQCSYDPYGAHNKHRLFPQSTLMAYYLVNTSCVLGHVRTEVVYLAMYEQKLRSRWMADVDCFKHLDVCRR